MYAPDGAGGDGEIAAVMTAAIALTFLAALVFGSLGEVLRFGLQQVVEGLLHAAADTCPVHRVYAKAQDGLDAAFHTTLRELMECPAP